MPLVRILEWAYTLQSLIGLGLSLYASWDAHRDQVAARGGTHYRLHRMIVLQAYALAGSLGILHSLLLWLGAQALLGPLPAPDRQPAVLHIVAAFVVAQFVAIALQVFVVYLRKWIRDEP